MPNPPLLLCDTDALFQYFIAGLRIPFQELKKTYGIQPAIVPEVEIEIRSNRKYGTRCRASYGKAISSGAVQILDQKTLQEYLSKLSASVTYTGVQTLGAKYYQRVGRGEAYTFATAVSLGVPALSHDISAIRVLGEQGFEVPSPVLQLYDLLVCCYQTGVLTESDIDNARKLLLKEGEWMPAAFKNSSFVDGLKSFCPRLLDNSKAPVGAISPPGPPHRRRIHIASI